MGLITSQNLKNKFSPKANPLGVFALRKQFGESFLAKSIMKNGILHYESIIFALRKQFGESFLAKSIMKNVILHYETIIFALRKRFGESFLAKSTMKAFFHCKSIKFCF